jgi:hypothetical protein
MTCTATSFYQQDPAQLAMIDGDRLASGLCAAAAALNINVVMTDG